MKRVNIFLNKCSDRIKEMYLPAFLGNYDRTTDRPKDRKGYREVILPIRQRKVTQVRAPPPPPVSVLKLHFQRDLLQRLTPHPPHP